jgi:ABC-type dipeptide/oligopeptide/nickel transport system permease component
MDINTKHTLGLAHGILMVFVWVVAVPIAVAVPMYAKKKQKTWGAKVHMSIMATAAFLPFTVSAIMAFVASGSLKLRPHSVSEFRNHYIITFS